MLLAYHGQAEEYYTVTEDVQLDLTASFHLRDCSLVCLQPQPTPERIFVGSCSGRSLLLASTAVTVAERLYDHDVWARASKISRIEIFTLLTSPGIGQLELRQIAIPPVPS